LPYQPRFSAAAAIGETNSMGLNRFAVLAVPALSRRLTASLALAALLILLVAAVGQSQEPLVAA
jgi:hypothetical protein